MNLLCLKEAMRRLSILSRILALTLLACLPAIAPELSAAPLGTPCNHQGQRVDAAPSPAQPVLQGSAATMRLKEQGHYESLVQAMKAARYAVEAVQDGPAAGAGGECYAGNPAHALRCWFRADGLELQPAGAKPWKLNLRLLGYGRATLETAEVGAVSANQNRVELSRAHGAVMEWYENRSAGLEQGFTLRRGPQGEGPFRLVLEAEGDLRPELEPEAGFASDGSPLPWEGVAAVKFVTAEGQATLRYSGLKVRDAAQRTLPAHIEVQGRQLALVVDDRDAVYPVTIDPLITHQEAKLTGDSVGYVTGGGAPDDFFGCSVSLSGDGTTALVGVFGDDIPDGATGYGGDTGSAYVFVRSGSNWIQQAKLPGPNGADDYFGSSVSLSGDGNTALIGAPAKIIL
jgi:hypothetical protein